jgi:hypothetical protein
MAALAVLSTLLLAAGCSGDDAGPAATGSSAAAAPASAGASGAAPPGSGFSGHDEQVCDQATLASTDFGEVFLNDLQLRIDAGGKGAAEKAQAQQKITRDVQEYTSSLAGLAKIATDPALQKALTRMSKEATALKGDVAKIDTDKLSELSDTLDKACYKS